MRVLSVYQPFFCPVGLYACYGGHHEIRSLGTGSGYDYTFDPRTEDLCAVLARVGRDWAPELLLCWNPEAHPPPRGVEHARIPTVALVSDWMSFYPALRRNLGRYDHVFTDRLGLSVFNRQGIQPRHVGPLYSHFPPVDRIYPGERDIDVLFVGNINPGAHVARQRYLERLARLPDRYRVVIATGIYGEEHARLMSRARIVFNHALRGEVNVRVFQTMAAGAMALIEAANLEAGGRFRVGEEIVTYGPDDFEAVLNHYLDHPQEAQAIAARGQARMAELSGAVRFDDVIDAATTQPGQGRPFLQLTPGEQEIEELLQYVAKPGEAFHGLAQALLGAAAHHAGDPRYWTALGRHYLSPERPGAEPAADTQAFMKSFLKAHQLAPQSAPYALNAASAFRWAGHDNQEAQLLQAALAADSLEGAALVVGGHADPFWVRWQRAVAEEYATQATLHGEAHVRLAHLYARLGNLSEAETHLGEARALDPGNAQVHPLLEELLWRTDRRDEAIQAYAAALDVLPLEPAHRRRLAEMMREAGRTNDADVMDARAAQVEGRVFVGPEDLRARW